MKQFFEQYGGVALGILAVLVLIAMITPVGNIIKTSLQGTANKFSGSMYEQLDGAMNATASAQNSALSVIGGSGGGSGNPGTPSNPYKNKVANVQKLYDVGEASLTADDIVTVNGVDCYVLQVDETNKKAELMTVNIYKQIFDSGNSTNPHIYPEAEIGTFMNNFYIDVLGSDSRILDTEVTYYYAFDPDDFEYSAWPSGTVTQKVFALNVLEGEQYQGKFDFSYDNKQLNLDGSETEYNTYGFWLAASFKGVNVRGENYYMPATISYDRGFIQETIWDTEDNDIGARPVFWITLE